MKQIQWVIVDKIGCKMEGAYETKAQAVVALERNRLNASKLQFNAKLRVEGGKPYYTDKWDVHALEQFEGHEWRVVSEPCRPQVYRLNADISNDECFCNEVVWKLRVFSSVEISWMCHGHTRAEMQGASTAAFLASLGYSASYGFRGNVFVKSPLCK